MKDLIIIGAGTAGLAAAIYARRAGLSVEILENNIQGGQIVNSPEVENYPGIKKTSGFEFVMNIFDQATSLGAEVNYTDVSAVDFTSHKYKTITVADGTELQAKAVIIANGAKHRLLGCKGEEQYTGRGVSYCATCDGAFYKDKTVVVAGGGNTALEEALYLASIASEVYILHRRDQFRGDDFLVDQVKQNPKIKLLMNSVIEEICADEQDTAVEYINVKDTQSGNISRVDTNAVFIAIGLEPKNQLFSGQINIDDYGYIIAGEDCKTNIEGVYAAGDTRTTPLRQLITAAADGAVAATMAAEYIRKF